MSKSFLKIPQYVTLLLCILFCSSCYRTSKLSTGEETKNQKALYKQYMKVSFAAPGEPLGTTSKHISNVSRETAIAKMSQALNSYDSRKLKYNLSTVFHIATNTKKQDHKDEHGHEHQHEVEQFALNFVVVNGHAYWVAPLDFVATKDTYYAFQQIGGIVPAIEVVDAEDETRPAWLRFEDDLGHPYKITIRYQSQQFWDDSSIFTHLQNAGYWSLTGCNHTDTPVLEPDDHWRLYYAATRNHNDTCNTTANGGEFYAEILLLVDAQTGVIEKFQLDNPNTPQNERDPNIPKWLDKIYSPWLILRWANRWGFNLSNYLKFSEMDELRADGNMVDEVMNADDTNVSYVLYMVSRLPDHAVIGVLVADPQDATAKYWKMDGENAMSSKSAAIQTMQNAVYKLGFSVEDMTPHTIYGRLTWEAELCQPFRDANGEVVGSHYAGTALLEATDDLQPAHVMFANTKHEAFTKYEEYLYLKPSNRVGSNLMEDKQVEGIVSRIIPMFDSYLLNLVGQDGLWQVKINYIGDPRFEDVLDLKVGDRVFMHYGDTINRKTHLVREIRDLTHPGSALHPDVILNLSDALANQIRATTK